MWTSLRAGGADVLTGDAGDDQLCGGAGKDRLIGGLGRDTLAGGTESDVFQFAAFPFGYGSVFGGFDTVTDFRRTQHVAIDVTSGIEWQTLTRSPLVFRGAVVTSGFSIKAGSLLGGDDIGSGFTQVWTFTPGGVAWLIGDVNDNRVLDTGDLLVRFTGTMPTLDQTDFVAGTFIAQVGRNAINDALTGTADTDRLYGVGGDDTLVGFDGDDYLSGGEGTADFSVLVKAATLQAADFML